MTKKITLHDLKTELYRLRIKPAHIVQYIAEAGGGRISAVTVRTVLNGHGTSRKVWEAVAHLSGMQYDTIMEIVQSHKDILPKKRTVVND